MSHASRPLSGHPAFRVMVALWFAALLGFGTFVMPAAVFERAVESSGLASALPGAAPPLGDDARIAISAVAALLGALLGLFVAGRAARAHTADELQDDGFAIETEEQFEEEPARFPLRVREELGEDFAPPRLDGPEPRPDSDLEAFERVAIIDDAAYPAEPAEEHPDAAGNTGFAPETVPEEFETDDLARFAADPGPADGPLDWDRAEAPQAIVADEPVEATGETAWEDAPQAGSEAGLADPHAPAEADEGEPETDLASLSRRLEQALARYRARGSAPHGRMSEDESVVAFPRRDGESASSPMAEEDPRAGLRSALDKLSRIGREG